MNNDEPFRIDVDRYIAAEKTVSGACIWRKKTHADYREVVKVLQCLSMPEVNGELRMTAHVSRLPQKMSFSLLLGPVRVYNLDVNPGTFHINVTTLEAVYETHWQRFPIRDAVPDKREMSHRDWLLEFCKRSNIRSAMAYNPPPHEPPQLSLL